MSLVWRCEWVFERNQGNNRPTLPERCLVKATKKFTEADGTILAYCNKHAKIYQQELDKVKP